MTFLVREEVAEYDPALRNSWAEGGLWPHANHFHFHEAVVAAHFILHGYQVLRDYSSTQADVKRPVASPLTGLRREFPRPSIGGG